jgi:lysophospholipase
VAPFADNTLTKDPDMYAMMKRQVTAHPELALGGPSVAWLIAGLVETRALAARHSPPLACLTALGGDERIIALDRVHDRMARWPGGRLDVYPAAEHEILMEIPAHRTRFFDAAAALFRAHSV